MSMRLTLPALLLVSLPAAAHDGVQNPAVKARMAVMEEIQAGTKVLGQMLNGMRPFEPDEAEAAAAAIRAAAPGIVPAFRPEEDDPKSEASPAIWLEFPAFEAEATALEQAAAALDTSSEAALKASFATLGKSCRSCHASYQE
ncbi:cytochrome c [Oceanicola sp. 502str15]|uniref:c-type cytochrome n=1 Tax=Oceanicola sp. 502str15 TaxID=2696061 RepID=UPI002095C53D|nr:cytochrome c [Oceanicola sp. 502str15]MCO6383634.1 cytochrome c [Oceanicola sp. 502str15]